MNPDIDREKRCFTYCGPEFCNCPAREAETLLDFICPALPVLATILRTAGLKGGEAKANEMSAAIAEHRAAQPQGNREEES